MARRVSSSEARDVIERTRALINGLEKAQKDRAFFEDQMSRAVENICRQKARCYLADISATEIADCVPGIGAGDLVRQGARSAADFLPGESAANLLSDGHQRELHDFISECIEKVNSGVRIFLDDDASSPDVALLASYIQAIASFDSLREAADDLLADNKETCEKLIAETVPVTSPLKRLFAPKEEKALALQSYESLSSLLEGDFGSKAQSLISLHDKIRRGPSGDAVNFFKSNPDACRSIVQSVVPGCLGHDDWRFSSSDAKNLCGKIDALLENLESTRTVLDGNNESVRNLADRCLAKSLMAALREIPVEELNRSKNGIRVSALSKAGYKTVADVYCAKPYSLRSVRGVGDSSVIEIKRVAKQYADEAKEGLGFRLNADDRTPESTRLVCSLYSRIKLKRLVDSCDALALGIRAEIADAESNLSVARRGSDWLFASMAQKQLAEQSYDAIEFLLHGEFGNRARGLLRSVAVENAAPPISDEAWNAFVSDPIGFNDALEEICPGILGDSDGLYGLPEDLAKEVQEECFFPDGLLCKLRRYQEWGVKYILHQGKVLLGDEMGLGKTVQAIATMVSLRNVGCTHFLVVCPASVLENWCREIRKHSKLSVTKVHGATAESAFESWRVSGGAAVTTYETTAKLGTDRAFSFDLAIVDEAHYIKNPDAARTSNVLRLCGSASRVLFMTGTALENRVDEMLTLIADLRPDIAQKAKPLAFMSGAQRFRDAVAPVYYRRKRSDVLTELPDLIENEDWCQLGAEEQRAYEESLLSRNFMAIRRVSWNVDDLSKSSKARRLKEIVADAADDGRKALVFTFFLDTAWAIADMLGEKCAGVINGSVPPAKRQEIIEEFDSAPAGSVLIAQIQSGGTGLNIQSASVVIICEPQFKPSIENQAISRAYRMGQARNVLVHRLLCENSVDEKMTKLLQEKQRLFDAFADKSTAAAAEKESSINSESFGKIVESEIERLKKESHGDGGRQESHR